MVVKYESEEAFRKDWKDHDPKTGSKVQPSKTQPVRHHPPLQDRRPAQDIDRGLPKSRWESIKEGIRGGASKAGEVGKKGFEKAKTFAQNHPMNNTPPKRGVSPKKEPNRANWKEAPERRERGRVSSRDIYKDGVLQERIHYGPAHPPAQKPAKRGRGHREDPLGGLGAGMRMSDFLPNMTSPFMDSPALGSPAPRKGKKKGSRASSGGEPFSYIDHMRNLPPEWGDLF